MRILRTMGGLFRGIQHYAQGGDPLPEAVAALSEYLSDREELSRERWVSEILRNDELSSEIAGFTYDFFASFHIPVGRFRTSDRIRGDLNLNEALQDDWDEELVGEFKKRFGRNLAFARWPSIVTVGDLLNVLQQRMPER